MTVFIVLTFISDFHFVNTFSTIDKAMDFCIEGAKKHLKDKALDDFINNIYVDKIAGFGETTYQIHCSTIQ